MIPTISYDFRFSLPVASAVPLMGLLGLALAPEAAVPAAQLANLVRTHVCIFVLSTCLSRPAPQTPALPHSFPPFPLLPSALHPKVCPGSKSRGKPDLLVQNSYVGRPKQPKPLSVQLETGIIISGNEPIGCCYVVCEPKATFYGTSLGLASFN